MARIAIIGGGSMGEALLSGLLRAGRQVKDLVVAERLPHRARYLAETYSVLVTSVVDAAEHATYIIVAVKPSDVESVVGEIAEAAAQGRGRQRRAGVRHDRRGSVDGVLRIEVAGRVAGDPGDAECAHAGGRRGQCAGAGTVRQRASSSRRFPQCSNPSAAC